MRVSDYSRELFMEQDNYVAFRKFLDLERAQELANLLKASGIEYELVDNSPPVDITFTGNPLEKEIQIKVKQDDFDKANKLLEEQSEMVNDQVKENHYLYEFSNEELYEVLKKYDEWSAVDFNLAQRILTERGEDINPELISRFKEERLQYLAQPERSQKSWIVLGYLFAFLGGLLGIFIGWLLMTNKRTLPNGQRVFAYNQNDRNHGRNIFIIGIIILPILVVLRISSYL